MIGLPLMMMVKRDAIRISTPEEALKQIAKIPE